jgi:hypothetical protein
VLRRAWAEEGTAAAAPHLGSAADGDGDGDGGGGSVQRRRWSGSRGGSWGRVSQRRDGERGALATLGDWGDGEFLGWGDACAGALCAGPCCVKGRPLTSEARTPSRAKLEARKVT